MPWLVGSLLAAVTAYMLTVPMWSDRAEGLASDFLFRFGRLNPPRASDRIVHVDIDDSSLESFGRWPWKRSLIGKAITTIDSYGPSVIALDLLFDERTLDEPEQDRALVNAIREARAQTIVAIKFPSVGEQIGPLWRGPEGAAALRGVIDGLKQNIYIDPPSLMERAGLDEIRAQRVNDRFQSFRELAVEEAALELTGRGPLTVEAVLDHMAPRDAPGVRDRGLERLIRKVVDRINVTRTIAPQMPELGISGVVRLAEAIEVPVMEIATAATHPGFVTTETDRDGAVRRVPPVIGFGGRLYPQLGVAAAMAHQRLTAEDIRVDESSIRIGQSVLPVNEGRSLIAWPRTEDGSPPLNLLSGHMAHASQNAALGLLRQAETDPPTFGHVAIGVLIDLDEKLTAIRAKREEYESIARELADAFLGVDRFAPEDWTQSEKRAAIDAELLDQVLFVLGSTPEGRPRPPGPSATSEEIALWRWYQMHDNIDREQRELFSARDRLTQMLRGKIVFVGWVTTGSLSDVYPTAAGPLTPGVVVNAMMANMVLTGEAFSEAPLWVGALLTFALGSFAAFVAGMRSIRPLLGLLLAAVIALGYLVVNAFLFFDASHQFVPLATPMTGIAVGLFGSTFSRGLNERRERSRLTRQFGNRIHRRLFQYLLEHPDVIDMSGSQREVTCLFGDLAGFTSVSETMDSRSTVAILNKYMGSMNALLTDHEAYVNKFLGDGLMAFWGAFEEDASHADRAVRAAIACVQRVEELNLDAMRSGEPRLTMRFGLSSGLVTVGDCGAPPEFSDFTVIGDSVNLAARLESANKQFGTSILINGRTNEMIGPDILRRPIGLVTVVGQSKPVELFEVLPVEPGTDDEELISLIEATAQAVRLYRDRRLDEARSAWEQLVAEHGQSRLCALYLREIARFTANAEELFDGVIHLESK